MDTEKPWHRDRATLYTLTDHVDGRGRTSQVNDNWFCVHGPDAEAVAERIRLALATPAGAMTLHVSRGKAGLWYVTSPSRPGLLVAESTWDAAWLAVPGALADLEAAVAP